jgi:hypothetical protein
MSLHNVQVISPAGKASLASPAAAERLKGEGWTVVTNDAPAAATEVSESDKAEKKAAAEEAEKKAEADKLEAERKAEAEKSEAEKKAAAKKPAAKKTADS